MAMAELYNGLTLAVAAVGSRVHRARPLAGALVRGSDRLVDRLAGAPGDRIRDGLRDRRRDAARSRRRRSPSIIPIYIGSSVILGILRVAAWAYLLASALRGIAAGEDPRAGWQLAALASGDRPVRARPGQRRGDWSRSRSRGSSTCTSGPSCSRTPSVTCSCWRPSRSVCRRSTRTTMTTYIGYDEDNDAGFEDEEAGYEGGPVYDDEFPEEGIRQARSVGQRRDEVAQEVEPLVDRFDRGVGSGHQDARPAGQRDAGQVAPRLGRAGDRRRCSPRACR